MVNGLEPRSNRNPKPFDGFAEQSAAGHAGRGLMTSMITPKVRPSLLKKSRLSC